VWCKLDPSWASNIRVKRLNRALGDEGGFMYLVRLWGVAMSSTSADVDLDALEDDVEWPGEAGKLVDSLLLVGFIDDSGSLDEWFTDAAADFLELAERNKAKREKSTARMKKYRTKNARDAQNSVTNADKVASRTPKPASRDAQNSVTNAQERKKERKTEGEPQTLHVHTNTPGPVIDEFVEIWQRREVEASRKHKFADRGFFGNRGPFALKETLIGHRDRRGPADKVETALATFWHWWDTAGKKIKGTGWRPSPMDFEQTLEVYLVERGMLSMADWLVQLNKAYST
jgi:hypothetical protein